MILCCNHFSVIMIITVAIIVFCPAKSISPQEKDRKSLELIKARVRLDPSQMLKNWDPGQGFKDACKMVGISCDRQKRVIGIDIAHFNLVGELYMVVGCLDRLQSLNISHNYFSGSIPLALFYSHDLVFLDLSHNRFHGFVPAQIGLLKSLQALDFSHNLLEGEMPANITMCKSLLRLNLGHNRFSGMVFSSILPLESLVHLEIQSNRFSGIIPPEIKNWAHLETFNIANNRFHGEIPAELDMLPKIISINLSFNRFKYSLEAFSGLAISLRALSLQGNFRSGGYYLSIGFYPQLEVLDLTNNFLAGQFPLLLCSMTSLRILRLAQNSIKGRLPEEIGSMSNLEVLDLSNNLLRGNIPPNIGQLKRLEFLDLSDNQFSNTIPSTIYDCQSLKSINLALNKLNGMIPSISIGQLTKVEYLNLSENSLVGSIPEELVYLVNIKAIDFSVNKLSNTIPSSIQSLPRLQHFDVHQNLLNGPVPDNPMFRRMPLYYFWNNSGLCGWVNASPCPINSEKLEKNGARAAAVMIIVIIILLAGVVWRVYNRRPDLLLQQTLPSSIRIMLKYSFTSSKLEVATRGFCEENCIGEGLKYKVYKGVLDDRSVVAIKLFKDEFREQVSIGSFVNECKAIVQLRHQNLVTVLGWCANSRHMAIVMEFMGNGSLEECLLDEDCPLIWSQRLDIALDVAQGLLYLHQRWQHAVHCDLKADNILLDDDCHAHISELKVRSTVSENITPATYRRPRGSLGYIAPECEPGSDISRARTALVYSYGVLLLELITNKRPVQDFPDPQLNIAAWVRAEFPQNAWDILDPFVQLTAQYPIQPTLLMEVALACTNERPESRPIIEDIIPMIENVINFIEIDYYSDDEDDEIDQFSEDMNGVYDDQIMDPELNSSPESPLEDYQMQYGQMFSEVLSQSSTSSCTEEDSVKIHKAHDPDLECQNIFLANLQAADDTVGKYNGAWELSQQSPDTMLRISNALFEVEENPRQTQQYKGNGIAAV